jgi:hypothetical protein
MHTSSRTLGWWYWAATLPLLVAAVVPAHRALFAPLIAFTTWQGIHFLWRTRSVLAPPVQTRTAYTLLLVAGLWPPLAFIHWIQVAGTAGMVLFGYCPLARMLSLMPWNRHAPLTTGLIRETALAPPSSWRFTRTAA